MIVDCIKKVVARETLGEKEIDECIKEILSGEATQSQVGALLAAISTRGERAEEIAGFARTLSKYSVKINPKVNGRIVDTCGTGGDGIMTFNISTVSAFVAAGAGCTVAKHGNRSFTSRCGSADLLEAIGYNLNSSPELVKDCIEKIGIGFIFAPLFHPALKSVANIRKEIGIRTIFNIMGPLLNPANANAQILGVYSMELVELISNALLKLGKEEAMVFHSLDGLDEISVCNKTVINHIKEGKIERKEFSPSSFKIGKHNLADLIVNSKGEAVSSALAVIRGEGKKAMLDAVIVNSAAAIIVSGKASNFQEGIEIAKESIYSGKAAKKLFELLKFAGKKELRPDGLY